MNFANEIKTMVSAKEAAEFYGYKPNRSGFVCCPFHGEDTPSLKVYDGAKGWHCYGCHAHGDVVDLVAQLFGISFQLAQQKLNEDFQLGLPIGKVLTEEERRQAEERARAWQKKQEKRRNRINAAKKAYWGAFDKYAALDLLVLKYAPKRGDEWLSDKHRKAFWEAIFKRNKAEDEMDKAQDRYFSILMEERS